MHRLLAFLAAALLIASPAGAQWVAGTATMTVPVTTETPYTQDFQLAGPLTGMTTSMCRSGILLSFDASIGDASSNARIRWFTCDEWTDVPPSGSCQEIPIKNPATGATLNEYTDFSLDNPQAAIVPLASAPTVGGDTARATLKCETFADSSAGPGSVFAGVDPFFAAECAAPPLTEAAAIECLATYKATASELVVITESEAAPVGLCANPNGSQCIHYQKNAGGDVVATWYGVDGEAYAATLAQASGYLYPADAAACLAAGDEPALVDKVFQACPDDPVYSTHGYDAPTALPKWQTFSGANQSLYALATADTTDNCFNRGNGAWTGVATPGTSCTFPLNPANTVRISNYVARVGSVADFAVGDTFTLKLWGCPASYAGLLGTCTSLGTLIVIDDDPVPPLLANGNLDVGPIVAGTYASLVIGADGDESVDAANNADVYFSFSIQVEN